MNKLRQLVLHYTGGKCEQQINQMGLIALLFSIGVISFTYLLGYLYGYGKAIVQKFS
jgi:hypothetical protein